MRVKHCVACGTEARPKLYHPSSLRVEVSVWVVAILAGLIGGTLLTAFSSGAPPGQQELQGLSVRSAPAAEVEEARQSDFRAPPSTAVQVSAWLVGVLVRFLKSAWWVIPIPLLFSLWRQFRKFEGCIHCRARELVPVAEDEPPWAKLL